MFRLPLFLILFVSFSGTTGAQTAIDEDDTGAWYMYFFSKRFEASRWGLQGDIQYRNWDLGGDLEQLLLRGGLTWSSAGGAATYTLGYASITSGEFGSGSSTTHEHRLYQEGLFRHGIGERLKIRHRLRFEQRWVEDQDVRSRFRYGLFVDIPLNNLSIVRGTWYLAFYNELFLNMEHDIGNNLNVDTFDRNRLYAAAGYGLTDRLRLQAGYMHQSSSSVDKGQIQISLHQAF